MRFRKFIGYLGLVTGLASLVLGIVFLQGSLFEGGLLYALMGYTLLAIGRVEEMVAAALEETKAARRAAGRTAYLLERSQPSPVEEGGREASEAQ